MPHGPLYHNVNDGDRIVFSSASARDMWREAVVIRSYHDPETSKWMMIIQESNGVVMRGPHHHVQVHSVQEAPVVQESRGVKKRGPAGDVDQLTRDMEQVNIISKSKRDRGAEVITMGRIIGLEGDTLEFRDSAGKVMFGRVMPTVDALGMRRVVPLRKSKLLGSMKTGLPMPSDEVPRPFVIEEKTLSTIGGYQ